MTTSNPETARLEAHLEHVRDDIGEMKNSIAEVAKAINTLATIETKQAEHASAISRAFGEIGSVSDRVKVLELQQPLSRQTQGIVNRAVEFVLIAVFGALLAVVVTKPAEVKAPAVIIQPAQGQKTMEAQTNGAPK